MFKKKIVNNFVEITIKTWLKIICKRIDIYSLNLILNEKYFGKVDKIYLEANDLIYQDLYVNKIIIKIYDCNLKFNNRNHLVYSEDLIINSLLTIDNKNLENIFLSKKWDSLRIKIEKELTENQVISGFIIKDDLIKLSYDKNKTTKEITLSLNLKENLIYLENINNKKKIFLPSDENIKFNICNIKNEIINIDLSSRVIFDN